MDLNPQQEIHLSHYWNVVRKRWKVALAIVSVVMLGTFLASYFSRPLYRSWIQLQIEQEANAVTIDDLFGIAASDQEFLQTQYALLQSRGLSVRVVEDHKLENDPELNPGGVAGKTPQEVRKIQEGIAARLLSGILIEPVRNTSLVRVYYTGTSPRLAQKVAEGWGESFIRMNIAKKLDSVQHASDFLQNQIITLQADLETARNELQRYGTSRGIVAVGATSSDNVAMERLTQLNQETTAAQNAVYEKQAAYNALQRTPPEAAAGDDPTVQRLAQELSSAERQYSEKLSVLKEGHPDMKRLSEQIEKLRAERSAAVQRAYRTKLEAARAAFGAAASHENASRAAYNQQRQEAQRLNIDAARYLDLRMAVETKQGLLGQLQKQLTETQVAARLSGAASSNIHIIDHAELPGSRFNLSMKKNLQAAFPLGLILGLAAIFFLEYMDRSIKNPEELERVTDFASLGVIPAAGSMSSRSYGSYGSTRPSPRLRAVENGDTGVELIPHTDARSPVAESYRALRTSLLLASANSPKVIVITSSFAREGKTTTSVNLATVLAQMGKPVLLVDADLRRPRLQKVFPGKSNVGLVNYLAANAPLDDAIQPTEVPHLSVVLSGPIPPNPSELLASDRMKHLIEEVRSRFAYVIFDSPPVLAVTDAVVLATNADGVVLCVHGGQTPRELVQRSAERLRQANIPVLGAILNNLDLHQYGYTYKKSYYDYYASDEPSEHASQRS